MPNWFRTNQAIGIYLSIAFAILLAYLWFSPWAHRVMRDGFMLGLFPMFGAAAMLFCSIALIIDPLRREVHEDVADLAWLDLALAVILIAGVAVYFAIMTKIGFVLVTPVFIFVYMMWFGVRPVRLTALLAVTIPVGIYIMFSLLGVRLPNGMLPPLF